MYATNGEEEGLQSYAPNQLGAIAVVPVVSGALSLVKGLFGSKPKPADQRYLDLVREMQRPHTDPKRGEWIGSMMGWAQRGDAVSAQVLRELQSGMHGGLSPLPMQPSSVQTAATQTSVVRQIADVVVPELLSTKQGQAVVDEVIASQVERAKVTAAPWLIPVGIGAALLLMNATRK